MRKRFFGHISTSPIILEDEIDGKAVRVMVTHRPARVVDGVDFNIYGHLHNNLQRKSGKHREDFWVEGSAKHFNACVEMTEYRPMQLQEMVDRRRAGMYQW
jgi:calcineurin-like phosphoesterase family protein